jgi:hypothetical protein
LFGLSARWLCQPFQNRASFAVSVKPTLSAKTLQLLRQSAQTADALASARGDRSIASSISAQISQSMERRIRACAASTAERNRAAVVPVRARVDAQGSRPE